MANEKGAKYKFRNSEVKKLLHKHEGNISEVARELKVARSSVYRRMKKFPELQKVHDQEKERMLDRVEAAMYREALAGNITALIFTLKTQGRHRGWNERQELSIDSRVEHHGSNVKDPESDAAYLAEVLKELRRMGMTKREELEPEIIDGELAVKKADVVELGSGLGDPEIDPTEEAESRTDVELDEWDKA